MTIREEKSINTVKNVASTMAIEAMYLKREFLMDMLKVAKGEKTSEEIRREVIKRYARQLTFSLKH